MLIIVIPASLFFLCFVIWQLQASYSNAQELFGMLTLLIGMTLFLVLLFLPINRLSIHSGIAAHEELRIMHEMPPVDDYDRATWLREVSESNKNLARAQYYAVNPWTSWYYPSAVLDVEPIR